MYRSAILCRIIPIKNPFEFSGPTFVIRNEKQQLWLRELNLPNNTLSQIKTSHPLQCYLLRQRKLPHFSFLQAHREGKANYQSAKLYYCTS